MVRESLLALGAEARLEKKEFFGAVCVQKTRVAKTYRHSTLDARIRRERTRREASMLSAAKKCGVRVPLVLHVDLPNAALAMEWIDAETAKAVLSDRTRWICSDLGKMIAALHAKGLIHGDLTTSNVLVDGKRLVLIDFGLAFHSEKDEDRATDLLNLKKMFSATHPDVKDGWERVLRAYESAYPHGTRVAETISQIEKRTRYS
jgi:Kae1-associated kinase Bud32